jgi:hypothetical protein
VLQQNRTPSRELNSSTAEVKRSESDATAPFTGPGLQAQPPKTKKRRDTTGTEASPSAPPRAHDVRVQAAAQAAAEAWR